MNIVQGLLIKSIFWFIGINFVIALLGSGLIMMRGALKDLKKNMIQEKERKENEKDNDDVTKKLY